MEGIENLRKSEGFSLAMWNLLKLTHRVAWIV